MDRRHFAAFLLLTGAAATGALAQLGDRRYSKGGGGGPPVAVFQILAIDTDARTLQLKAAADGAVSTVKVPDGVYDLSKLKVGDRVQVNFYVPDAMNPGLRASDIWPLK